MGILNTLHAMSHGLDRYNNDRNTPVVTIELARNQSQELCAKLSHELNMTHYHGEGFKRLISPGEVFECFNTKFRIIERA